MTVPRYLPAIRAKIRSVRLGPLSVRTSGDCELGTLMGFLIDPGTVTSAASLWKWSTRQDRNKSNCQ